MPCLSFRSINPSSYMFVINICFCCPDELLMNRFDGDCKGTDNEYGSRSHNVNERVIPYLSK